MGKSTNTAAFDHDSDEGSSDDELPDLATLAARARTRKTGRVQPASTKSLFSSSSSLLVAGRKDGRDTAKLKTATATAAAPTTASKTSSAATTVRRRKLGQKTSTAALQGPWKDGSIDLPPPSYQEPAKLGKEVRARSQKQDPKPMPRVELRPRKEKEAPVKITTIEVSSDEEVESGGFMSAREEITFVEEVTVMHDEPNEEGGHEDGDGGEVEEEDDRFHDDPASDFIAEEQDSDGSEYRDRREDDLTDEEDEIVDRPRPPLKPRAVRKDLPPGQGKDKKGAKSQTVKDRLASSQDDLTFSLSHLRLTTIGDGEGRNDLGPAEPRAADGSKIPSGARPLTPPKSKPSSITLPRGLKSPTKLARIPATPHQPASDLFWSSEFVNEWNEEHSPRKRLFPDARRRKIEPQQQRAEAEGRKATAVGGETNLKGGKNTTTTATATKTANAKKAQSEATAAAREARHEFDRTKQAVADAFLRELDDAITGGRIGRLTKPTGGIKVEFTRALNTTAGRARWKRETVQLTRHEPVAVASAGPADVFGDFSLAGVGVQQQQQQQQRKQAPPPPPPPPPPRLGWATVHDQTFRHHATVQLAEKVLSDRGRLLDTLAHEFCHLATFMVDGVMTNPHGPEWRAWARKCEAAFGASHGVVITTRHRYDIDYRYVWVCDDAACGHEYKRHSKSIDPARHRCGLCRAELRQIKPVPRGGGGGGQQQGDDGKTKKGSALGDGGSGGSNSNSKSQAEPSAYQKFMKEQMKRLRLENPGSPQKDIMKKIGEMWTAQKSSRPSDKTGSTGGKTKSAAAQTLGKVSGAGGDVDDHQALDGVVDGLRALAVGPKS